MYIYIYTICVGWTSRINPSFWQTDVKKKINELHNNKNLIGNMEFFEVVVLFFFVVVKNQTI